MLVMMTRLMANRGTYKVRLDRTSSFRTSSFPPRAPLGEVQKTLSPRQKKRRMIPAGCPAWQPAWKAR